MVFFPLGKCHPVFVPPQDRAIASAIAREPASLRTGRVLTGAAAGWFCNQGENTPKAAQGRLFPVWEDSCTTLDRQLPPAPGAGAATWKTCLNLMYIIITGDDLI